MLWLIWLLWGFNKLGLHRSPTSLPHNIFTVRGKAIGAPLAGEGRGGGVGSRVAGGTQERNSKLPDTKTREEQGRRAVERSRRDDWGRGEVLAITQPATPETGLKQNSMLLYLLGLLIGGCFVPACVAGGGSRRVCPPVRWRNQALGCATRVPQWAVALPSRLCSSAGVREQRPPLLRGGGVASVASLHPLSLPLAPLPHSLEPLRLTFAAWLLRRRGRRRYTALSC